MTGQSPSFSMPEFTPPPPACTGAQKREHEPDGDYLTPSTGKCLGGFCGVTANFARIDLYARNNTNPQKRAGP